MDKKFILSSMCLLGSIIVGATALGFSNGFNVIAGDEYTREFTFNKNTPLDYTAQNNVFTFKGNTVTESKTNRYISYDIYGYGNTFTSGGDSFISATADIGSLTLQGDFFVNGLKSISISISKYEASYSYCAFEIKACKSDNSSDEETININKVGTTTHTFNTTKGYDKLNFNAYCLDELTIDSITLTYDCTSFYTK